MECPETKKRLSEYIDGVLDAGKTAQIEKHLKACADCRSELEALERLIQTLGSMDTLKAPEGFMAEVHERIKRRSWLSGISKILFVPFRVKIPIQVASLATACLLLFLVFHNMRTQEKVVAVLEKPRIGAAADRVMPAGPATPKSLKPSPPGPAPLRTEAQTMERADRPFQLLLRVSRGGGKVYSRQRRAGPVEEKSLAPSAGALEERSLNDTLGAGAHKRAMKGKISPGRPDPVGGLMKRLAGEVGGRIIYTRNDRLTGRPVRFSVEIPARRWSAFLKRLSAAGSLEPHAPSAPSSARKMVRLDILILYDG